MMFNHNLGTLPAQLLRLWHIPVALRQDIHERPETVFRNHSERTSERITLHCHALLTFLHSARRHGKLVGTRSTGKAPLSAAIVKN
jgi:hypothetical protein